MIKKLSFTAFITILSIYPAIQVQGQSSFYLHENGVTVMCPDADIGETGTIFGVTYTKRTRNQITTGNASTTCTSGITDMSGVVDNFFSDNSFNEDISHWDVSNVTDMSMMFFSAGSFNSDISNWDVSNVTRMGGMFIRAGSFNADISHWDVSNVTYMNGMFFSAGSFNTDLSRWDVSNVTNMNEMFGSAGSFNGDLSSWDVSNVTTMEGMFQNTDIFNADLSSWDVSNVTDMQSMFQNADIFNADISSWDVSNVTNMRRMFTGASSFNSDLSNWDVSNVTNMSAMFVEAFSFNADISSWDVSNVTNMRSMFTGASSFNSDLSNWDVSNVMNMNAMFAEAGSFNADISNWDVSNVTDMDWMFTWADSFNQDLSVWCVSNINFEPDNFSEGSSLSPSQSPIWGTCPGEPGTITLTTPADNATGQPQNPTFEWLPDEDATVYQLEVFEGAATTVIDTLTSDLNVMAKDGLKGNTTHFWRVRGINKDLNNRTGEWSSLWSFTTDAGVVVLVSPEDGSANLELSPTLLWEASTGSDEERFDLMLATDAEFTDPLLDLSEIQETSYSKEQPLEHLTTYYWKVRSVEDDVADEWSEVWSFTTFIEAPEVTELTSPTDGSVNVPIDPQLSWAETDRADTYQLRLALDAEFNELVSDSSGIDDITYSPQTLAYNTDYYWQVRAVNEGGEGEWSEVWTFFTEYALEQPVLANPADEASDLPTSLSLSWNPVTDAIDYQLQVALDAEFDSVIELTAANTESAEKGKQTSGWKISQDVEGLDFETIYHWRVRALNNDGTSDWSVSHWFETEKAPVDGVVSLSSPADVDDQVPFPVEFKWENFEGANSYDLQYAETPTFSVSTIAEGLTQTEFETSALNNATSYYWRVRAEVDGEYTAWSDTWTFTTKSATVEGLVELQSPANQAIDVSYPVELSWDKFDGADEYELQISSQQNFATSVVTTGLEHTEATITETFADTTTFYWRVRATVGGQMTEWSEVWEFTTELRVPEIPVWSPDDGEENVSTDPLLVWGESERAESYSLQLSVSQKFDEMIVDASELQHTEYQVSGLEGTTQYYWRVQAHNAAGASGWSQILTFTTEVVTSISGTGVPAEFTLLQNYPNPFNPTTIITFGLPEAANVQLEVYNMLGQQVALLVNEMKSPGHHEVNFDASNLSSGVYLYRLQTDSYVETRQMMLIK